MLHVYVLIPGFSVEAGLLVVTELSVVGFCVVMMVCTVEVVVTPVVLL